MRYIFIIAAVVFGAMFVLVAVEVVFTIVAVVNVFAAITHKQRRSKKLKLYRRAELIGEWRRRQEEETPGK